MQQGVVHIPACMQQGFVHVPACRAQQQDLTPFLAAECRAQQQDLASFLAWTEELTSGVHRLEEQLDGLQARVNGGDP